MTFFSKVIFQTVFQSKQAGATTSGRKGNRVWGMGVGGVVLCGVFGFGVARILVAVERWDGAKRTFP